MNTPATKACLIPLLLLLLAGCSRDDRAVPTPLASCPISFMRTSGLFLNIRYAEDGYVDTLGESGQIGQVRTYSRRDSLLVVTRRPSFNNSFLYGTDSVWINGQGLVLRHLYHSVSQPGTDSETFFTYNTAGELQQRLRVRAAGHDSSRTQYQWRNGDPVAHTVDGRLYNNEFAEQYPAMAGDYLHLGDLVPYGGYRTIRNRHLVTRFEGKNLSYEFSSGGVISAFKLDGIEYGYEYRCE